MTYKTILAYVDVDAGIASTPALTAAAAIAGRFRAHLTALHVEPDIYIPIGPTFPAQMIEWQERSAEERTAAAQKVVEAVERSAGTSIEWRTERGDPGAVAATHALYADLIVTSMHTGNPKRADINLVFESVLLSTGRPVLAIPEQSSAAIGKRVLIAWKAGRGAARAVQEALPFLAKAEAVQVIELHKEEERPTREYGADIALHLSRHGVAVELAHAPASDGQVGKVILERARVFGADLIVAGAYGHMRMREYVLGGTTVHLLRNAQVPVLMAH
jgi:nucleotide-binding universal stress UspA family protein